MENNIESMELEEMRQQMAALRAQLDDQLHLNEDWLQKIILKQTDSIHSYGSWNLIVGIIVGIIGPILLDIMYDFSLACCITTSVFVVVDAGYIYWSAHRIKTIDLSTKNLTETVNTLVSMKKMNAREYILCFILLIPLLYWWGREFFDSHIYDVMKHSDNFGFLCYFGICTSFICAILGIFTSVHFYKKQKRNINEMIDTLQEGREL